ncbi:MAG: amidohydrolase [Candidatus Hydrogenedentes bacterium]|nr:amidohydrolase [Candidatus Hydrogenedentota bacterium]MBI3119485.1 amidohydrolase [Candidatus Hydrogenedentota bacterium]
MQDQAPGREAAGQGADLWRLVLGTLVVLLIGTNVLLYYGLKGPRPEMAKPSKNVPVVTPTIDPKLETLPIINGHDHIYREQDLAKYLEACKDTGVAKTLFVASSDYTLKGNKFSPKEGNEWNSREVLKIAQAHPDEIIPFVTFHPDDANKLDLMKEYLALGAKGVKLYTGHSNFYDRPLQNDQMREFYAFCEQNGVPICWHVNMGNYGKELEEVLAQYPKLKLIIPHFGVGFFSPGGDVMQQLGELMDVCPGVYTDCSFGTRDILVSGLEKVSQFPEEFRAYYEKYQDRIVWGTDMVITGNREKSKEWIASVIRACRDMHEKSEYYFWMAADGTAYSLPNRRNPYGYLRGLKLPPAILKKVYGDNLLRLLGLGAAQ